MALEFVLSGVIMGIVLVATAGALVVGRDWRAYAPGGDDREGEDRTMQVVAGLLVLSLVAVLVVLFQDGLPGGDGSAVLYIVGLAVVVAGYLGWGVYTIVRSHGRATAEAVMASAWALGAASLVGLSVLLVLG